MAQTTKFNGSAMRVIRERSEVTVAELVGLLAADGVKVHEDHLRNIELGYKQPSAPLAGAIARALKCPKIALLAEAA